MIQVFDNIVPNYISNQIYNLTLADNNRFPWYYSKSLTFPSTHPKYKFKPGMKHSVYNNTANFHSNFLFLLLQPLYCFCLKSNFELHKILTVNSFLDLPNPTPGPDLPPHVDRDIDHYVLLYYINDSDGDTILFEDDEITEIKRVTPKKGRIVFFDGSIPHCGSTSGISSRAAINFNFLGKKLDRR
mgnify:CR=1 FL=1